MTTEPTTWAGRRMLDTLRWHAPWFGRSHESELFIIATIEAEAIGAERERIRAAVEALPGSGRTGSGFGGNVDRMVWATDEYVSRAAVLAIVDPRP